MRGVKKVWIFGYSKESKMIAGSLKNDKFEVHIVEANEKKINDALSDGFENATLIDIENDSELEILDIKPTDYLICVMDDEHLNVFLTLSLRSICPKNEIISISHSIHATQKLKMAGASKVIDLYQVSANRIHNIFKKPTATKILDSFISTDYEISFREFKILKGSIFDGMMIDNFDFNSYNIILIGILDWELGDEFIFSTTNISHKLDPDDIIVCLGKNSDLDKFEQKIIEMADK
ncbi:MAG: TrkA family potassium uptake protein [Epsilonproteobacteria bacterium]|nr:TrkA family potassium uptake protein [Campylobacterota bacterium]